MNTRAFQILTALAAVFLLTGCIGYRHSRESGTQAAGVTKEGTWFVSVMSGSKASAIKSETTDTNGYRRTLSVGSFSAKPDANTITNVAQIVADAYSPNAKAKSATHALTNFVTVKRGTNAPVK